MTWYKWEPGLIPYMERSPDLVRGILHRCADDYWRGFQPDLLGNSEAEKIWPVLKAYLDDQRTDFEGKANSRHIKAEHAASMRWASPSITRDAQSMLGMPEEKRKEDKKIKDAKPSRVRSAPTKKEPPKEETLETLLQGREGILWERYWKLVGLWPSDKNPAPKRTARAFLRAMEQMAGNEKAVFWAAIAYRDKHIPPVRKDDESRFMKNVETWLSEEGWQAEQAIMVESRREQE